MRCYFTDCFLSQVRYEVDGSLSFGHVYAEQEMLDTDVVGWLPDSRRLKLLVSE